MKAVVVRTFGPLESIGIEEISDPMPEAGEVVIDVFAVEANYPDLLVIEGKYQFKPPLPFSPGKAAAGRIVEIGLGVTGLSVGERVVVQVEYGAYAEKVRARADLCFKLPVAVDFATAAALSLVYQTAYFALKDRASFSPGEVVLVLGAAGGIGVASVQLARAWGAGKVIAGVRSMNEAKVAERAGADHIVDLGDSNVRDSLKESVSKFTNAAGVDVVVDPVGGEASAAALRALAWRGRLVIVGFASGDVGTIKTNYLLVKNISVSGLQWSDYRDRAPEQVASAQEEIFSLYTSGKIDPYISRYLPLAQFKEALTALRNGQAQGKIILDVTHT